jgi:hypothetical protein
MTRVTGWWRHTVAIRLGVGGFGFEKGRKNKNKWHGGEYNNYTAIKQITVQFAKRIINEYC